jgi:hypothetical protein
MSDIEYDCWYEIAAVYVRWPVNYIAYMRALGLLWP